MSVTELIAEARTLPLADRRRLVEVLSPDLSPPTMTDDEWRQFIVDTAGRWQGEWQRPDQGMFESHL